MLFALVVMAGIVLLTVIVNKPQAAAPLEPGRQQPLEMAHR